MALFRNVFLSPVSSESSVNNICNIPINGQLTYLLNWIQWLYTDKSNWIKDHLNYNLEIRDHTRDIIKYESQVRD